MPLLLGVGGTQGVNNSNDFPNLAPSRMWMAALQRNCYGFIWLFVCFFIGRRETERDEKERERGVFLVSCRS